MILFILLLKSLHNRYVLYLTITIQQCRLRSSPTVSLTISKKVLSCLPQNLRKDVRRDKRNKKKRDGVGP